MAQLVPPAPTLALPTQPKLSSMRRNFPACNVCGVDLSNERSFHQRYHVCPEHATADAVLYEGVLQRFCQQCGRFHELERFAQGMRSCRAQLARHAERRRKRRAEASAIKARIRSLSAGPLPAHTAGDGSTGLTTQAAALHPAAAAPPGSQAPPMVVSTPVFLTAEHLPSMHPTTEPPAKRQRADNEGLQAHAMEQPRIDIQVQLAPAPAARLTPPLPPAGRAALPAGRQLQHCGSGKAGSSPSQQSTHSTQRQHSSQGLDALLAAAEEEEQGAAAAAEGSGTTATAPATAPLQSWTAPLQLQLTQEQLSAALPPMPKPEPPPLVMSTAVEPPTMPALTAAQPWPWQAAPQPQWQQPAPQQPDWLAALAPQPAQPAAPAVPPQLLQLLQHLATPSAAAAFGTLVQQLATPRPAPPPVLPSLPVAAPQDQAAVATAALQAAASMLARQDQQNNLQHLVALMAQQQAPAQSGGAGLQQLMHLLMQG